MPLASGRDADVFALPGGRVLRRYRASRAGAPAGDVTAEAEVMRYVHDLGYPVPAVHAASGPDLVLDRVDGRTMLAALLDGLSPAAAGELLADLHARLHALPARTPGPADHRLLHLDLHPDNVLLAASGPVVIDWTNAADGPPDLDVALTAVILAEVAIGLHVPAVDVREPARELLVAFLAAAGGRPVDQLDRAVAMRAANRNLSPAERAAVPRAADLVRAALRGPR